jgi:FtsP/CotA-like multicopper oxidase with cupredoxin domain
MSNSKFKWLRSGLVLMILAVTVASGALANTQSAKAQQASNVVGIVCTTSSSPNPIFTLDTDTGYIQLPDGTTMFMWGYSLAGGAFQHPGPVLCVNEGDTVTVILNNTGLTEDVSIAFPGQENVLANGALAQPQFSGTTLTSLTNVAAPGGSVTYSFVASNPGSFLYESGTNPQKQVHMGLFGALIVRPSMGANFAYDRADSRFTVNTNTATEKTRNEEFMVLLSEIDPYQHWAAEQGKNFNLNNYHPRYWLINGRGFPDSIADNFASFLPDQPYGALARITPFDAVKHPYPGLIHYLNVGTENYPFHPHGNNGLVIGRDGRALEGPAGQDLSFEKFAINIGPGQTWDVLFKWYDAENYSDANPVPVTIPQVNNQQFGMFYSGSPYLGQTGTLPPGASTLNQCGEYYIIAHNHALFQITSWGVNMTGPITYVRVDPPLPNNCP